MTTPISSLVSQVQARLEEFSGPGGDGEFWSVQFELRTALIEAMNDLLLLVGRPMQTVNSVLQLTANTVWQTTPSGILLITNLYGARGEIRRASLHDMDYVQSSWSSGWEQDIDLNYGPARWFPVGMNMFGVHPAPAFAMNLNYTAITYPTKDTYPYTGSEPVVFHDEIFAALEEYSALYARLKEGGGDLQQALTLYRSYLSTAERMTQIEDRRDPAVFSVSFGGSAGLNPLTKR